MEQERDGCVSIDKDGDGIPNAIDRCPDQPEDKNGFEDDDGCPDEDRRLGIVAAGEQKRQQAEAQQKQQEDAERRRLEGIEKAKRDAELAAQRAEQAAVLAARKRKDDALEDERRRREAELQAVRDETAKVGRRGTAVVLGAAALGCGVLSAIFFGLANGQASSIKDGGLATASEIESASSSGATFNALGIISVGLAVVGAGIALPLYLRNQPARPAAAASATAGGGAGRGAVRSAQWRLR
jgi:hypothetical protein